MPRLGQPGALEWQGGRVAGGYRSGWGLAASAGGLAAGAGQGLKWHPETAARVVVVLDNSRIVQSRTWAPWPPEMPPRNSYVTPFTNCGRVSA